jgi:ATP-dependent DNA helicase RecG
MAGAVQNYWETDITYLKKVGPKRANVLISECNIRTFGDLLHFFPRKYVDRSQVSSIRDIREEGGYVTLVGKIRRIELSQTRNGRGRLTAVFSDETGVVELNWFQGIKWIKQSLTEGEELAIFGRPTLYGNMVRISHPEIDRLQSEDGTRHTGQIVPFYPSTEKLNRVGLDSRGFRTLMHQLLEDGRELIQETLNPDLCRENGLVSRREAILNIHFPENFEVQKQAERRLKFEELFLFQLLLAHRRTQSRVENRSNPFSQIGDYFNAFYADHLPFELTDAQKRVIKEIRRDVALPVQMNRLVQGDVGSGKTMVAFMTMLMARDNGFQSAIMAPTEILARQHFKKISAYAEKLNLKVGILVGGQRKAERTAVLEALADGSTDIVVGTHALIEPGVIFQKLGLVVVDEQHKFGVMQRAKLWRKADPFPHNLIMTATPIPRTLAMTVYGDVDVSVIDELPPGRKAVVTRVYGEKNRLEVLGFIRKALRAGRQAYVVYPLVEESQKSDLLAAEEGYQALNEYFKDEFRVGIVHGRMKADDKEVDMQRFVRKEIQVLVSTTVIEVGVDVANATVMLIENAERFGLSQLHQLRGRVGRGGEQSYCLLMAGPKRSADARKRLKAMVETNDGFRISEIDLNLRGPGDFLGTRQSGLPEFQLANIVEDQEILRTARIAAFKLAAEDPGLLSAQNQALRNIFEHYRRIHATLITAA